MHLNKLNNKLKSKNLVKKSITFEAIGTKWVIDVLGSSSDINEKIIQRINKFDKNYSRFRKDSLVWKMSEKSGEYKLSADFKEMFDLYLKLYKLTEGKFTPLIGQVLSDAGYNLDYSFIKRKLTQPQRLETLMSYKFPKLTLKTPALFDFGGIGKGYLIDIISNLLEKNNISSYCIDAGGDIFYKGEENLRVGLENPEDLNQVIGVSEIKNQSIAASSGNRRKWGDFHHIIDPQTLTSPKNILATWVIADKAVVADSLATALFLVSKDKLTPHFHFEYLILYPDFTIDKSEGFNAEIFSN